MIIFKTFTFDAAHFLPNVPEGHKCKNLHGHTYKMTLFLEGEVDEEFGWVKDFGELKEVVQPILLQIDHRFLNEIEGLENPTCENFTIWIWNKLKPQLNELIKIELSETPTSGAIFEGE